MDEMKVASSVVEMVDLKVGRMAATTAAMTADKMAGKLVWMKAESTGCAKVVV